MKTDIILAGVGGQGILSIAAALGSAALNNNLYMKQAETHGMSQRGGDVQSFMRISDKPIFSDLIAKGTADIILSVEPMEALRYLPYLKKGGYVVTNATPFINIPNYPEVETLMATLKALPHQVIIDADSIAKEACQQLRDDGSRFSFHRNSLRIPGKRYHGNFRTQRCRCRRDELEGITCRT